MTAPQIQIACAKACGWTEVPPPAMKAVTEMYHLDHAQKTKTFWHEHILPNYTESHDAMAEALGTMTEEEWEGYVVALHNETVSKLMSYNRTVGVMLRATPLQQAVAFLKAKNLYTQ